MTEKYALGIFNMLCDALRRHNKDPRHKGLSPRRFVLHPAVYQDLTLNLEEDQVSYLRHNSDGTISFMDVPVIIDSSADQPKLITFRNVVEYL